MKHSELIRAAVPLMKTGPFTTGTIGLCAALERVNQSDGRKVNQIKRRIKKRLAPYTWARGWLKEVAGVPREKLEWSIYEPKEELQAWRRAWAEQLAQEYEAEGK
jgi:hypothetical protein